MTWIQWLIHADKRCFIFIQTHLTSPALDPVMLVVRNPLTWIPVYLFMLWWILKNDRPRAFLFILVTAAAVGITDYSTSQWLKPLFGRIRPCYDPDTMGVLRGLLSCGGRLSFPSNHATNHFCMATLWFGVVHHLKGKKWYWLYGWACLVCAGQVYVGKHFLGDIGVGALYGTATGLGGWWIFVHWPFRRFAPNKRHPVTAPSAATNTPA